MSSRLQIFISSPGEHGKVRAEGRIRRHKGGISRQLQARGNANQANPLEALEFIPERFTSAKVLAESKPPILDTAIYHCQQAAEKAIKGFLSLHGHENIKTHDIGLLVRAAMKFDTSFSEWQDIADLLTPYATLYRYPGEIVEPEVNEFQETLQASESFLKFIQTKFGSTT